MFRMSLLMLLALLVAGPAAAAPLASISQPGLVLLSVRTTADQGEDYAVAVEYLFDGSEPLFIAATAQLDENDVRGSYSPLALKAGRNTAYLHIDRPASRRYAHETTQVKIIAYPPGTFAPVFSYDWKHRHSWPNPEATAAAAATLPDGPRHAKLLQHSIALIDGGERGALEQAERNLQQLLIEDASDVRAYVELARVRMKQRGNWKEKLRQAEALCDSAIKINPDSTDALVLRGYVYGSQLRTDEALKDLARAEKIGTRNRWLQYNRGLSLQLAGREKEAIAAYQAGIIEPVDYGDLSLKSHNQAVPRIFNELQELLQRREDWAALQALNERRHVVLLDACADVTAAYYALGARGDYRYAANHAEPLLASCGETTSTVLGMAYLLQAKAEPAKQDALVKKALRLNADSTLLLAALAGFESTAKAIPLLVSQGVLINSDDEAHSPLLFAVKNRSLRAVKNLLAAGAKANQTFQNKQNSVLLAAVLQGQLDIAVVLIQNGADPDLALAQGLSVSKLVEASGDAALKAKIASARKPL